MRNNFERLDELLEKLISDAEELKSDLRNELKDQTVLNIKAQNLADVACEIRGIIFDF